MKSSQSGGIARAPPARSLIMFLQVRKRVERWAAMARGGLQIGKKRRAIIPQLLEISVSINLVSPRLRRRRRFALPRPSWFFSGTPVPIHAVPMHVWYDVRNMRVHIRDLHEL